MALSMATTAGTGIATAREIPLSEYDATKQSRLLKALADPTRLRLLSLLSRYEGEVCVFEIVRSFKLEQPTISHHLRILQDAGLIEGRKRQLYIYYYLRRAKLDEARQYIEALTETSVW